MDNIPEMINAIGDLMSCIDELQQKAKKMENDTGNPFFRVLQILEHLRT